MIDFYAVTIGVQLDFQVFHREVAESLDGYAEFLFEEIAGYRQRRSVEA